MIQRLRSAVFETGERLQLATALRSVWREGVTARQLRSDVLAGIVVGIIALPLSMALAIASGVPPQHGLYTAIVGGAVIALLGGSRVQVSGPTAAFVVILAPIAAKFGIGGLLLAGMMAGVILIAMGAFRLGRLIEFIPYPVTTGFTAGIAVVIATLQIKDLLGLRVEHMPEHYVERVGALAAGLPTVNWADLAVGAATLVLLIIWPLLTRRIPRLQPIPGALIGLIVGTLLALALSGAADGPVATINSRFTYVADEQVHHGIPQLPPMPALPWNLPGGQGGPLVLSWSLVQDLLPSALAIALLGGIESLLSAVIADGITGHKHDSDGELIAQGIGNLVTPLLGGIAATGAIARTAANIRNGGRTPVAAFTHAMVVLLSVLLLAPVLGYVPMASMAALLLMVAWNMSEAKHFVHALRVAPRSDVVVLVTCFALTVIFDMVIAVGVGTVLAALLFMRRMAEVADVRLISEKHRDESQLLLPPGVAVYDIAGPLFFGAAHKATAALRSLGREVRVVVLDMRDVPVMDATGLVNLESAVDRLGRSEIHVVLGGVQAQPLHLLAHQHVRRGRSNLVVRGQFEDALAIAAALAADAPLQTKIE